jgi:PAS domain-containing protein
MRRVAELEEAEKRLKGVEEALRETESHLDMAQELGHVGSWVYYAKTDVSKWSDEMYRIFGIPAQMPITHKNFYRPYIQMTWIKLNRR